jgi:hypothetical protein
MARPEVEGCQNGIYVNFPELRSMLGQDCELSVLQFASDRFGATSDDWALTRR